MSKIYEMVDILRKKHNISLRQLESETGISKSTIADWKGTSSPSSDNLVIIANYFDVSVDFLLGRTTNVYSHKEQLCLNTIKIAGIAESLNLSDRSTNITIQVMNTLAHENV